VDANAPAVGPEHAVIASDFHPSPCNGLRLEYRVQGNPGCSDSGTLWGRGCVHPECRCLRLNKEYRRG
jgi:hypothetical protein